MDRFRVRLAGRLYRLSGWLYVLAYERVEPTGVPCVDCGFDLRGVGPDDCPQCLERDARDEELHRAEEAGAWREVESHGF